MKEFVKIFKALSDQTRLRIICVLSKAGTELCVCEIMDSLKQNQYNISRHLKVLQNAGMVQERKEGRWMFYSLVASDTQFHTLIYQSIRSIPEEFLAIDYARLSKRLSFREQGKCVVGMNTKEWGHVLNELEKQEETQRKKCRCKGEDSI